MTDSWVQHHGNGERGLPSARWRSEERRAGGALGRRLRPFGALPVRAYLRLYHRLHIEGQENLPGEGSFVMVANHASHLDAVCMRSVFPLGRLYRTYSLAAQDYFFGNLRNVVPAIVLANAIPFGRRSRLRRSLRLCRQLLAAQGNVLVLFPEGTRTTTGEMGRFRSGVGLLVAGTNVPVVPCAIQGTFRAMPKGALFPRPVKVRMVIGRPRRYGELPPSRASNDRIAADLQTAVKELLCR